MALTTTTISAGIALGDLVIPVTSATGFTVGNAIRIGNEMIGAITAVNGTQISVRGRGWEGTAARAWNLLTPIVTGNVADFVGLLTYVPGQTSPLPPELPNIIDSYGASGAITVPTRSGIITLNKATAAAMTLADPSKDSDGIEVTFLSTTAAAHTITYTAGIYGDTTSSDVLTFAAKVGASCTLVASKGAWGAVALANVTAA